MTKPTLDQAIKTFGAVFGIKGTNFGDGFESLNKLKSFEMAKKTLPKAKDFHSKGLDTLDELSKDLQKSEKIDALARSEDKAKQFHKQYNNDKNILFHTKGNDLVYLNQKYLGTTTIEQKGLKPPTIVSEIFEVKDRSQVTPAAIGKLINSKNRRELFSAVKGIVHTPAITKFVKPTNLQPSQGSTIPNAARSLMVQEAALCPMLCMGLMNKGVTSLEAKGVASVSRTRSEEAMKAKATYQLGKLATERNVTYFGSSIKKDVSKAAEELGKVADVVASVAVDVAQAHKNAPPGEVLFDANTHHAVTLGATIPMDILDKSLDKKYSAVTSGKKMTQVNDNKKFKTNFESLREMFTIERDIDLKQGTDINYLGSNLKTHVASSLAHHNADKASLIKEHSLQEDYPEKLNTGFDVNSIRESLQNVEKFITENRQTFSTNHKVEIEVKQKNQPDFKIEATNPAQVLEGIHGFLKQRDKKSLAINYDFRGNPRFANPDQEHYSIKVKSRDAQFTVERDGSKAEVKMRKLDRLD